MAFICSRRKYRAGPSRSRRFLLDLLAEGEDLHFPAEEGIDPLELGHDRVVLKEPLSIRQLHPLIVGNRVGHLEGILQHQDGADDLPGQRRGQIGDLLELILRRPDLRLDLHPFLRRLRAKAHPGDEVGLEAGELVKLETGQAVDDQSDRPIGRTEEALDRRHRSDSIEVLRAGKLQLRITRRHQADEPPRTGHIIDELDGARLPDRQRHGGVRIHDQTPQGQDGQTLRDPGALFARGERRRLRLGDGDLLRSEPGACAGGESLDGHAHRRGTVR
jgi:hypothetical protein